MNVNFEFFSIEPTTVIGVLLNTFILLLVVKKFLFEPVNKVIEERKAQVSKTYVEADNALENAHKLESEYEEKLSQAKEESAEIVRAASERAGRKGEEITAAARKEADAMIARANAEIEHERARAVSEVKGEIAGMAVELAEKIIGRNVQSSAEQDRLINDFIDNI
ncbi:MAG: F0F1 ATP synthase subunit B [Oscillospiraceae bacterium]|nr:F0F1 ATP synthase subunit B [Oscillospiraceae bacterium]